jgi:small-conductance mechanosensitive channel
MFEHGNASIPPKVPKTFYKLFDSQDRYCYWGDFKYKSGIVDLYEYLCDRERFSTGTKTLISSLPRAYCYHYTQAALWGNYATLERMEQRNQAIEARGNKAVLSILNILKAMAQLILWTSILSLALDSLGFNIRTLITGLGIGCVAVALALIF